MIRVRLLPSRPPSSRTRRRVIIFSVVVIVALLSAYGAITVYRMMGSSSTVSPPSIAIFQGAEILPPSQWLAKNFTYQATNVPLIAGNFSSTGSGTDNSVRILVLTLDNFSLFEKTGVVLAYYTSGETASGVLNIHLPMGNGEYTFVLDNSFDSAQSKTVEINATLLV
ncbi:MAG TPA: hypothetical protein VJN71_07005 [Nitrososphaerales archaeon]|nr:hypothetical protein [Nitrososphaerales archaeon]